MRHCDPIDALYRLLRLLSPLMLASVLLAAAHADVVTYFHNDIAGTPMAATDANGHLLWKESYRPYGERLLHTATPSDNSLWYGGKPQDPATGLSYLGARYYNPQLGRFMGIDPKEVDPNDLHSFNRYAYANNNPYKYIDPDGKFAFLVFLAAAFTSATITDHAIEAYNQNASVFDNGISHRGLEAAGTSVATDITVAAGAVVVGGGLGFIEARFLENAVKWGVPKNVISKFPSDWGNSANKKGVGLRWQDPKNPGNGVRIDQGNPNHSLPSQQVDHVVVRRNGQVIGHDGKPIQGPIKENAEQAHIPLKEYQDRKGWDSPQ